MVYAKKDKVAQQLLTFVKIYYALDIYYCLRLYQLASNYFLGKHSTNKEILLGQVKIYGVRNGSMTGFLKNNF